MLLTYLSEEVLAYVLVSTHFLRCFGYKADVLFVENGVHTRKQFEIIEEELPPFNIPGYSNDGLRFERITALQDNSTQDSQIRHSRARGKRGFRNYRQKSDFNQTGVKVTGIFGRKLSAGGVLRWKPCNSKRDSGSSSNSVVTVEKGESVYLPCHDCESLDKLQFEARQWVKLDSLPDNNGMYRVREVIPDMHDDKHRNRIVINLDHVLHIKRVRRKDAGSYFCKAVGDTKRLLNTRLTWTEIQDWLANNVSLNHFYHIDVLDLNHESFIDVTNRVSSQHVPEIVNHLNILVQTRWTPWSECNVCDDVGIQKRIGVCVVKKLDFQSSVPDMYLDHILDFAEDGLLCKSEYLKQFSNEKWLNRPNEARVQECHVPCAVDRQKRGGVKPELISNKKPKKVIEKTLKSGEYLILVCPGSTVREVATWVNNTKSMPLMRMKKSTNERITFDLFGNLHFSHVILSDSAEYSCWIKKKLKKRFKITIVPNHLHEVKKYVLYLLVVFAVDFVVFIFLTIIKIVHSKSQVRKRKYQDTKGEDDDPKPPNTKDVRGKDGKSETDINKKKEVKAPNKVPSPPKSKDRKGRKSPEKGQKDIKSK